MMEKYKLLLVEDDPNLGQILNEYLNMKGYRSQLCRDGESGLRQFRREKYDLCILDIMMPRKDGFTLAKDIRKLDKSIPFIFLTAKSMKEDVIEGLKLGADDYIAKPFSMEELLLRIKAILKRTYAPAQPEEPQVYRLGSFSFDAAAQTLSKDAESLKLTHKESALLLLLCQHMNRTLDRSLALRSIWREDSYFNARSMDVYIAKLRKYLKPDENVQIQTIHGEGFRLINKTL